MKRDTPLIPDLKLRDSKARLIILDFNAFPQKQHLNQIHFIYNSLKT
jgi:hypothetical protein